MQSQLLFLHQKDILSVMCSSILSWHLPQLQLSDLLSVIMVVEGGIRIESFWIFGKLILGVTFEMRSPNLSQKFCKFDQK